MTTTTATRKPARTRKAKPAQPANGKPQADQPAGKAKQAKPEKAPLFCRCGCGQQVNKRYRQGHDARHASELAQAVLAGKLTLAQADAALDSDALKVKMAAMVERVERLPKAKAEEQAQEQK